VTYEKIMPRGMKSHVNAVKVWADADVLKQPRGTNDTGDRSVLGIWKSGVSHALVAATLEDPLIAQKEMQRQVRGQDLEKEINEFRAGEIALMRQKVQDPFSIQPGEGERPF
jgi:hypothetical protein